MSKPRILLVPNVSWWILAYMAEQTVLRFSDDFEFLIVPETVLSWRPDFTRKLLESVDLVHCFGEPGPAILEQAGAPSLPPIITWIHHITQWTPTLENAVRMSSAIVVCTEGWKTTLQGFLNEPRPITVVRHGVDSGVFRPVPGARKTRGIPDDDFVVGFFGVKGSDRDGSRKGIDTFVSVIQRLRERVPRLRVVISGPGWDSLVQDFASRGIPVTSLGYLHPESLPAIYSMLDVYLVTARVEGGPCTVLESMACGTPVVATRVGLVPDVIEDGINGYSCAIDDVDALVAALAELASSPSKAKQIGAAARATAEKLPWSAMLSPLGPLYTQVLAASAPRRIGTPHIPAGLSSVCAAADVLLLARTQLRQKSWPELRRTLRNMSAAFQPARMLSAALLLKLGRY